jgi:hypothetical protein
LGGSWTAWPWKLNSKFTYIRDKNGEVVTDKHPAYLTYVSPSKVFQIPTKNWNKNCDARIDWTQKLSSSEVTDIDNKMDKEWKDNHKDEPKWMYAMRPKPKIFEYDGDIWHHLGTYLKSHQILATKDDWYKSTMEDYRIALDKEMHQNRKSAMGQFSSGQKVKDPMEFLPSAKSPFRYGSKDHLECFIEKI